MRIDSDGARDVLQTIMARRMLGAEAELAHLNIGVTVTNRVAVLWGPVPSAEAAFRAELCLRTMIELVEVRNQLFVCEPLEPVKPARRLAAPPAPAAPEQLPPRLPKETRLLPGAPGMLTGQDVSDVKHQSSGHIKVMPADRPSLPTLGVPQVDAVKDKSASPPPEKDLASAIRDLLQRKAQYRGVQFTVEQGRVYLRSDDAEAVQDAAREIARLPQVEGVIVLEKTPAR